MRKRIGSVLLIFAMLLTLLPVTAKAVEKDNIPTKVRTFYSMDDFEIELADTTQSINNIRTNSKNAVAMLTGWDYKLSQGETAEENNNKNAFTISVRTKKDGTYTVKFDIVDKKNKKIATKAVKVYAYDSPLKSITFNGKKQNTSILTGKSAKVKVTLAAGNKIKKLEFGKYKKVKEENYEGSEMVRKTFKNGEKIIFGTVPYFYSSEYDSGYGDYVYKTKYFSTSMDCPTNIYITYYDKYTKRNETCSSYYNKMLEQ